MIKNFWVSKKIPGFMTVQVVNAVMIAHIYQRSKIKIYVSRKEKVQMKEKMVTLKINDYNQTDKDILFELLFDGLSKYCYSVFLCEVNTVENCSECPGKKVCRDIHNALAYIYHSN